MNGSLLLSSPDYGVFVHAHLDDVPDWEQHATVILDIPTGYALEQLERMTTSQRRATIILTPATHPAYLDILASYYVRHVAPMHNDTALKIMRALIKDDAHTPAYQPTTGLTFTQARVLRLILRGATTREAAQRLGISVSSINAHMANVFTLLGVHGTTARAELIRQLLIGAPTTAPQREVAA